jgi:hypothetical protein
MKTLLNNPLIIIGISNLILCGVILILVKSKLILSTNPEFSKILTNNILKYVVLISLGIIVIGLVVK